MEAEQLFQSLLGQLFSLPKSCGNSYPFGFQQPLCSQEGLDIKFL